MENERIIIIRVCKNRSKVQVLGKDARKGNTWTWAVGVGVLRLSERETMAHMSASMVTANVSKALAL